MASTTSSIYLFAYFTGNGEGGMKLASSPDGLIWEPVSDQFLIAPERGLMRDPFLYLGPDEQFHLIWTTNWESQEIGYASSADLVNWSKQISLPVMSSVAGTRNCWAPEMIFDSKKGHYLIFWSSTVLGVFEETAGSSETDYNHRIWATTTKDFIAFSEPFVLFDPGFNVIDGTLLQRESGDTFFIAKNETLKPVAKDLFFCRSDSVSGPYGSPSSPFTQSWVEGPATLEIGDHVYVYFDQYTEKRYGAARTRGFETWEDVSDQVSFPQGARHGSIVSIDSNRFSEIAAKFG